MKLIKRTTALSLTVLLVAALACPLSYAAGYTDVTLNIGQEYVDAINYMSDNGYMIGTSTNTFSPNENVTRGMLVTVLYSMSEASGSYTNPFKDVLPSRYYYNAVGWAYENGLVAGTSATTFSPDSTLKKNKSLPSFISIRTFWDLIEWLMKAFPKPVTIHLFPAMRLRVFAGLSQMASL